MDSFVQTCISNALRGNSNIPSDAGIVGMSGVQNRHFYNNLFGMSDVSYLVVGVGDGSALCGAMVGNSSRIFCIDGSVNTLMSTLNEYKGMNTLTEIADVWSAVNTKTFPVFDVLVYNGESDSTGASADVILNTFVGCMDSEFVLVVENWNDETVREGINGSISDLGLQTVYSREIYTPGDGFPTWWNGIFVVVLSKT
jgi:hypothetical protein